MTETPAEKPAPETKPAPPVDDLKRTSHTLELGRRTLRYTATTGRVVLREEIVKDGVTEGYKPKAQLAVTAYTLDEDDAGGPRRPIVFAFNGGPGSASAWLHLGLLGPRRVVMGDAGALAAPPYELADNHETLLAHADLVFIDPVSTGQSRVVEGEKAEPYHGYKGDIESVSDFIRLWVTRENRWGSAKFVMGESYGTTRAAAVAERLQSRYGMYLNGVILISSILDFGTVDFEIHRNDRAHALYLPHYAATAHFHGKHGRTPLAKVLKQAEEYAARDYPWVLARGNRLTARERAEAVATLSRLTGLTPEYVDRAELRIEHWRYYGELLREEGLAVGRLDSRFTGPLASRIAESMEADPSMDAILGPYATSYNRYVRDELGYESDLPWRVFGDVHPWSYKEFEGKPVYVVDKLERAMRQNGHLQVHLAYGYYDGATPYFSAQDVVAHLQLPESLLGNIEHKYYPAGHMMYVHEESRVQQSADLAAFVQRASGLS